METIVDARQELFDKLTPTLRREVENSLETLYEDVRRRATLGLRRYGEADAAERLPTTCPCTPSRTARRHRSKPAGLPEHGSWFGRNRVPVHGLSLGMSAGEIGMLVGGRSLLAVFLSIHVGRTASARGA
jgi:hypothetical protein